MKVQTAKERKHFVAYLYQFTNIQINRETTENDTTTAFLTDGHSYVLENKVWKNIKMMIIRIANI